MSVSPNLSSLNYSDFDSEVMALIQDLSLVLAVSKEGQQWWTCWLESRFSRYPLCERYKQHIAMLDAENARLMHRLARRNYLNSKNLSPDNWDYQLYIFDKRELY